MATNKIGVARIFYRPQWKTGCRDGIKVDAKGNLYCVGPGGKHLGTIKPPQTPANCNWGDDGTLLYITARTGLYRIKLAAQGERPLYEPSL